MRRALRRLPHGGRVAARPAKADIFRCSVMQLRRLRSGRRPRIDDSRQRLVVDLDQLAGVKRLLPRLRDDNGDGLADVTHARPCQRPARRFRHRLAVAAADRPERAHRADTVRGHIGAAENGDNAGRGLRARSINAADDSVGVRRAHDRALQFGGNDEVGDETSATAQQPDIFDAPDRSADPFLRGFYRSVYCNSSRRRSSRS